MLNQTITEEVNRLVREYDRRLNLPGGLWDEVLVGAADVCTPYIRNLRRDIDPGHQMPEEVLPDAKTVLVWYVPFKSDIVNGNGCKGLATADWARAYELTNTMLGDLNDRMIAFLASMGFRGTVAPEALKYDRDRVISHWSQRHLACAAGLGTFGLNNMLITAKGCSGRLSSLVTNIPADEIETGMPQTVEKCRYKRDGSCGLCADRCETGALTRSGFDRHKCNRQCLKNAAVHRAYGSSYCADGCEIGSEVCGKCLSGLPCSFGDGML